MRRPVCNVNNAYSNSNAYSNNLRSVFACCKLRLGFQCPFYPADLSLVPPEPKVLTRNQLVHQLGGVAIAGGEFGHHVGGGGGMLVMETSDSLGGALGGVQRLTTDGGVLQGKIAPRALVVPSQDSSNSPESLMGGIEEIGADSDQDVG